jgi:hypothetical protein
MYETYRKIGGWGVGLDSSMRSSAFHRKMYETHTYIYIDSFPVRKGIPISEGFLTTAGKSGA